MKLRKILSFSLLFIALAICMATPIFAGEALSFTKGETISSGQIVEGVKWEKFKGQSVNDEGAAGNQVVNYASIAPGAAKVISWAIPNGNGIKPSTLLQAAADFEATYPDYQVIAGINNDYFGSNSSGVFSMRNTSVVDGVVFYAQSQYSQMYGLAIGDNNEHLLTEPGGKIEISTNYYLDIYDATNTYVIDTFELNGFNQTPGEGETTVIYEKVVEADGFEIFEIDTTCNSRVESVYYFEGKYSEQVSATTSSSVAIATQNLEVANAVESGAKLRIYKTTAGKYADYDYVLGCPAQSMKDGTILSSSEIKDYGYDHVALRHPRTAIGFKEDGTMFIMVVDGRQPEKGMDGVSERENALILKQLGCVDSFNFDGGGSSTFAVLINGQLTVTNSPSDGGLRSDANHLLVVVPRVKATYNVEQELTSEGKVLVKGSAEIQCNDSVELLSKPVLLVDGVTTGQDASDFEIELEQGQKYHLGLQVSYNNGTQTVNKGMCYQEIETIGEHSPITSVSEPEVKFTKTNFGFTINVDFKEGKDAVTDVKIEYEGKSPVVRKTISGFMASITSKVEKEYTFKLTYSYRFEIGNKQSVVVENIKYTYGEQQVVDLTEVKEAAIEELTTMIKASSAYSNFPAALQAILDEAIEDINACETLEAIEELVASLEEEVQDFDNVANVDGLKSIAAVEVILYVGQRQDELTEANVTEEQIEVVVDKFHDDLEAAQSLADITKALNDAKGGINDLLEPEDTTKPGTSGGCAFGASVISSFILLGALLILINKRR